MGWGLVVRGGVGWLVNVSKTVKSECSLSISRRKETHFLPVTANKQRQGDKERERERK